jgi:hypothetical protein
MTSIFVLDLPVLLQSGSLSAIQRADGDALEDVPPETNDSAISD